MNINNVLIIEQSIRFRRLLLRFFSKNFPQITITEYYPEQGCPNSTFSWEKFDLLILGYELGINSNGLEWLRICKTNIDFPAIIFITDQVDYEIALEAIRYGAHNYLSKEKVSIAQLKNAISDAIKKRENEITRLNTQTASTLFNRTYLYKRLDSMKGDGTLILVHIDNHYNIYYKIGFLAVDSLAIHLAKNISIAGKSINTEGFEIVRINDNAIAAIILGVKNIDVYTQFINTLFQTIHDQPFMYDGNKIDYGISVGVTQIQKGAHGAKNNLTHADLALRMAMDKNENSFVVFGDDVKNISLENQKLITHIKDIIRKNLIRPFFQLIINTSEASQSLSKTIYILRTKVTDTNGQLLEYKDIFPLLVQG